jgi:hypothetical protein
MPVNKIAECLHGPDHRRNTAVSINLQLEHIADSIVCRPSELAEKRAVEAKVHPQAFRDGKHPLSVRDIGKNLVIKAMCKQKGALLVTGGTAKIEQQISHIRSR